jgi:hypothetical protein
MAAPQTYKTSLTVEGPVTVEAAFGTYHIGKGDSATFRTDKNKEIVVSRQGQTITVLQPKDMTQSFVVDTLGPNSSATLDFSGGKGGGRGGLAVNTNKGHMIMKF